MINVAVIGAGHWGPNLSRTLDNKKRSRVVWLIDNNPERREQMRGRYPDSSIGARPEAAFEDERVEAVVIATPTATHFELARAALKAGKHVLVEKPIAATVAEGEELCRLAAEAGLVLMVGHIFIYNLAVRFVKCCIDEGRIGQPQLISMTRTNLGPIRTDVNAAWDLMPHDLSMLRYWLGADPDRVTAFGGSWANSGVQDMVQVGLIYPGGVIATIRATWLDPAKDREVRVIGTDRMLTFDDMNATEPVRIHDKGLEQSGAVSDSFAEFRSSTRDGDIISPKVATGEPLAQECEHFLDCIEQGQTPETSGSDGVAVVRVLEAITRSLQNNSQLEEVT